MSFISPILRLPFLFANLAVVLGRIWVGVGIVAYPDDHCVGDARENVKPMAFTSRTEFVYHTEIYCIKKRLGQQVITRRSNESCVYCLFESSPIVDLLFSAHRTRNLYPSPPLILAGTGKTTTITAKIAVVLITCSLPHVLKIIGTNNFSLRDLFADAHPVSTVSATPYT